MLGDYVSTGTTILLHLSHERIARLEHQRWNVLASYDESGALVQVEFVDAVAVSRLPLRFLQQHRGAVETSLPVRDAANESLAEPD